MCPPSTTTNEVIFFSSIKASAVAANSFAPIVLGFVVMHSPAVAESLAAMINGDSPPIDIRALSPQRTEPLIDSTQL